MIRNMILTGLIISQLLIWSCSKDETPELTDIVDDDAELNLIADGFEFAEGPAYYSGDLYFSDIEANIIYKWAEEGDRLDIFNLNSGGTNGLYFDNTGNLYACESNNKQVVVYKTSGLKQTIASEFDNAAFNQPNDLWVAPNGNIYFSDPNYTGTLTQDGEHVYLITEDGTTSKVVDDLVRPNGLVGTSDGKTLYITDHGAGKTYRYSIEPDGTLNNKELFINVGADGLTIDALGNVYLASDNILVYNSSGILIKTVSVPGTLTNLCFGGLSNSALFITTHDALYSLEMNVQGK